MTRRDNDFYPTPPEAVLVLLQHLRRYHNWILDEGSLLEPSAGAGAIIRVFAREDVRRHDPERWHAIEVQGRFRATLLELIPNVVIGDAIGSGDDLGDELAECWPSDCHVIANPPFSMLDAFVAKALRYQSAHCRDGGRARAVIVLTRAQWLDEGARAWIRANRPPDEEVHMCWRISFTGDGAADNATYSWFIWLSDEPNYQRVTRKFWREKPPVAHDLREEFARLERGHGPQQGELGV